MGLITGLITLPLAPVRGVAWIGEILAEEAERAMAAERAPDRRLAEIEVLRASGEIDDEEARAMEAEVIDSMLEEEDG